jgi:hypothetical protein
MRCTQSPAGALYSPMSTARPPRSLPRKRTGRVLSWIARRRLFTLIILGAALYFSIAVLVSAMEVAAQCAGHRLVQASDKEGQDVPWWDILYFNLITILTVGYGDLHPISFGKILSVLEAFSGAALFSVSLAVVAIKLLAPPPNTIAFSKHAFYCTGPELFMVVFINTTDRRLASVAISSYFKLGGDWSVKPHVTAPLLTQSVQTFYVERLEQGKLIEALREGDCLRVGIDVGMDFSGFSTSVQYSPDEILVIADRRKMVEFFEPRSSPDLASPELAQTFDYGCDANAPTLRQAVEQARRSQSNAL